MLINEYSTSTKVSTSSYTNALISFIIPNPIIWRFRGRRGIWNKPYTNTAPKCEQHLKTLKEIPTIVYKIVDMPFMFIDGQKMRIDNDIFDTMSQLVQDEITTSSEEEQAGGLLNSNYVGVEPNRPSRWRDDGTYDKKPLDPNYFKKYYQNHLKQPFTCPDCGKTISSKSNLSKHQQTAKCRNAKITWWCDAFFIHPINKH